MRTMPERSSSCTETVLQPISIEAKQTNGKGAGKMIPRASAASSRKLNIVSRYAYCRRRRYRARLADLRKGFIHFIGRLAEILKPRTSYLPDILHGFVATRCRALT